MSRRLQRPPVDASPVLARYAATNSLIEGTYSGSLGDPELLGKDYRDYNWTAEIVEVASNHLYGVTCAILPANGRRELDFAHDHVALPPAIAARQPRRRHRHEGKMKLEELPTSCPTSSGLPLACHWMSMLDVGCRMFPPSESRAPRRRAAFTLIEIMVAMMVFSMVIAAIYSTWALVMRATQVGQDAAAQAQRQRVVLRAIGDALMGVESFQASQKYYWFKLENGSDAVLELCRAAAGHLCAQR